MNNALLRDLVVLVARIAVGVVFVAHGWQKISTNGIDATAGAFDMMGVPAPTLSAWFAAIVELVGGALLIAGLALPVAALLLFVDMLGAFATVHMGSGVFVDQGGYELVLALGVVSLLLAAIGAGRFSLDRLVAPKLADGITA
ncbi:DoxX family protein [Kineosporia sp. NBRC 101731]|uniref:DoxX family protein n=1 Tax=Kineosporia sp. NBRC 101731 TaxID=3032199 RepID=UPI0024A27901|nr:DoxX family protein [Kineosporia sp. NBRC 101731]GLY28194.1 hypothetical protein Kisp02_15590 [Kineosporia sp. NBRC 101731]